MKRMFVTVSLISITALLGCDAQKSSKTAADVDWTVAWKDGRCVKTAGQDPYVACLEKSEELTRRNPPPKDGGGVISGTAPSQETSTETATTVVKKEETTVLSQTSQPTPPPPQVTPQPPPPFVLPATNELPQMKFPSGGFIFVPVATGPYCSLPKGMRTLEMTIANGSDYLLEVQGKAVPLNCEVGDKFVPAKVMRHGENKTDDTWVIRGDAGRVVLLVLNGGLGDVTLEVHAFMDLGPDAPAPEVGFVKHKFHVPASDGGSYVWDISPSRLTGFR